MIIKTVMIPKNEQVKDMPFEEKVRTIDDYTVDTVIKMMRQKTNIASQISKIVHEIDTTNRIENIEKIIENIPMEMLAEAKVKIAQ